MTLTATELKERYRALGEGGHYSDSHLTAAISEAVEMIRAYGVNPELPQLRTILMDIAHARVYEDVLPPLVKERYEVALEVIKRVATGATLPYPGGSQVGVEGKPRVFS